MKITKLFPWLVVAVFAGSAGTSIRAAQTLQTPSRAEIEAFLHQRIASYQCRVWSDPKYGQLECSVARVFSGKQARLVGREPMLVYTKRSNTGWTFWLPVFGEMSF